MRLPRIEADPSFALSERREPNGLLMTPEVSSRASRPVAKKRIGGRGYADLRRRPCRVGMTNVPFRFHGDHIAIFPLARSLRLAHRTSGDRRFPAVPLKCSIMG